jgi:hypothetical protein
VAGSLSMPTRASRRSRVDARTRLHFGGEPELALSSTESMLGRFRAMVTAGRTWSGRCLLACFALVALYALAPATSMAATAGDYDGNGTTDIVIFRPSDGTWQMRGAWSYQYGVASDIPVPGDYNGDGKTDIAIFRPSDVSWQVRGQGSWTYGVAGDIPVPGDYDGNGTTDIAIFRPSTGSWQVRGQGSWTYGVAGDIPVPGDYNGDGKTDIAIFRPSTGSWQVYGQGSWTYGVAGDIPVPGDYDGDHKTDIVIYRPSDGTWQMRGAWSYPYGGQMGDVPVPGDYYGDGKTDIAFYRPSDGTWQMRGAWSYPYGGQVGDVPLLRPIGWTMSQRQHRLVSGTDWNGDNKTDISIFRPSDGGWQMLGAWWYQYGVAGDIPQPGDYTGDGKTDIMFYRPSDSSWQQRGVGWWQYGAAGDIPVSGDYDGDGKNDIAIYRPSTASWQVRGQGSWTYGLANDVPVPGDYDGDGRTDIAIYRPSDGSWQVRGQGYWLYGQPGDIPVPGDYNGDGRTDLAFFRPSDGSWQVYGQGWWQYGVAGDVPVPGDYNGDGKTDIAIYRPSNGSWQVRGQGSWSYGGQPGDIPLARPNPYLADQVKPTATISGGLYDARNQTALTDGAISVAANDNYSGVTRISVIGNKADGTIGQIAGTTRNCNALICAQPAMSWSGSIDPVALNWSAGSHHLKVEVADSWGNTTTVEWDVQYYPSSWWYGSFAGVNHVVDTVDEVQRFLVDLPDSNNEYTDIWNDSPQWAGLTPAEQDYVIQVTVSYPEEATPGGYQPRVGIDLLKFGIVHVKLNRTQTDNVRFRVQQVQIGAGVCAAIAAALASELPPPISNGAKIILVSVCAVAGLTANTVANELAHDLGQSTHPGVILTIGVKVTMFGFPNPLPIPKKFFSIDPWNN